MYLVTHVLPMVPLLNFIETHKFYWHVWHEQYVPGYPALIFPEPTGRDCRQQKKRRWGEATIAVLEWSTWLSLL